MAQSNATPSPLAGEARGEEFSAAGYRRQAGGNPPCPLTPTPSPARGDGRATGSRSEQSHAEG